MSREDLTRLQSTRENSLEYLIDNELWDFAYARFTQFPQEANRIIDPSSRYGWTFLHWLSSTPSTPDTLIELVASLNPSAINMPDTRYGDTPLHLACRNSQISHEKVRILLKYCPKEADANGGVFANAASLVRNSFGGTVLHAASNHNARIEAIKMIVDANPKITKVRTHEGLHAVTALWISYVHTIPGTTTVARLLSGGKAESAHFERFWEKVVYLSTVHFAQMPECPPHDSNDTEFLREYVLHGLIRCDVPINPFMVALRINPDYARAVDANGNLPIHLLVQHRPYRLKEKEAIMAILEAAPESAGVHNNDGENPLIIGIRNKIPWEKGLNCIVDTSPCAVTEKEKSTGLYPFQLAALHGGKVAVETTFQLLCKRPDLVSA